MRFLLFLGLVGLAWAQDPLVVEGTVVNGLSGSPLGQVAVYIYDDAGISFDAMTDASGRYRFVRAKPGLVRLQPTKRGFFADGGPDRTVDVTAGVGATVPALKLWPGGVISGTVTDEAGEPMAGVSVTSLRREYVHGRRRLVHVTGTTTDDRGEYRLFGLQQDTYFVCAHPLGITGLPLRRQLMGSEARGFAGPTLVYPPTFYPAATEADKAKPVAVRLGQEQSGANISLRIVTGFRLSARLMNGLTNAPLSDAGLLISSRDYPVSLAGRAIAGGKHLAIGLAPGIYDLTSSSSYGDLPLHGHQALELRGDRDDVVVTLQPQVQVRGKVRVAGEGSLDMSTLVVGVESGEDAVGLGVAVPANADGTFAIGALQAGKYSPKLTGLPAGGYLQSLQIGEQEATLDLSAAAGQTVETTWVVSMRAGKVMGRTTPGVVVALVPSADQALRQSRYQTVVADADGRYEFNGVAPGRYQVYAFTKVVPGAWMDDSFLAGLAVDGVVVKVEEQQTKLVDVTAQAG